MTVGRQLALPFGFTEHYDPAAFLADDSNAAALAWLDAPWPDGRLALWGDAGCGKTHLLHLWAARTGATLLPGPGLRGVLDVAAAGGLAVDDADAAPEEPLLHMLNVAAEEGRPLLLAAREAPARWRTRLPDLASRLRATAAVAIEAPGDAMLRALLAQLLAERQMAVPQALQDWMLLRLPRTPAALREVAARLDRAGGGVSRAVAEGVVGGMLAEG
jgi:chromosomal replication initiation ATPase DnaA